MNSRQKRASFARSLAPCFFWLINHLAHWKRQLFMQSMCVELPWKTKTPHLAFFVFGYDNVIHKITLTIDRSITQPVFLALSALYTFSRTQVRIVFSTFLVFWERFVSKRPASIHWFATFRAFQYIPHSPIFPISGHDSHRWYQSWTALRRFLHSTDTQVWRGGETLPILKGVESKGIGIFLAKCLFREWCLLFGCRTKLRRKEDAIYFREVQG